MTKPLQKLMDLRGRTALVTGAAGALGRVICETLAEIGGDLILADRSGSDLQELARKLASDHDVTTIPVIGDIELQTGRDAVVAAVSRIGRLDVLVNNAAFVGTSDLGGWSLPFEEQTIETWRRAIEVNLTAAFDLSQRTTPYLRASGRGSIINIGSIYGLHGPDWSLYEGTSMANPAAYAASKGGLLQLTRWLATTLGPSVRANCISPGGIARGQPEAFVKRYEARTPMKRMATESDFRGAIAFFASDLSAYVTGENLSVDGGWGAW
jgi:NAD(P)-dependent dehydrogenase (short-subunit alcohol dehydrogenase family)